LPGKSFWLAVERLPTLRVVYSDAGQAFQPASSGGFPAASFNSSDTGLESPVNRQAEKPALPAIEIWERPEAIRELVRGRLEVCGPITAAELADALSLPKNEIDAALLALEAEGFVLRGRFHPGAAEQEWCDRRLLARIHRLTIDRLRAEIQPVTAHE